MFDKDAVFHTCTDDKIRPYPALLCSCCGAGRNAEEARKVSFNAFEKVEQLQAENKKLKELAKLRDDLLVCYRIGKNPSDKLLDRLSVLGKFEKAIN